MFLHLLTELLPLGLDMGSKVDGVPDFDRLVVRAGDDLRAVVIEADRVDPAAVRVLLLRLKLESACERGQKGVRSKARGVRFPFNGRPASQTLIVWSSEPETICEPS